MSRAGGCAQAPCSLRPRGLWGARGIEGVAALRVVCAITVERDAAGKPRRNIVCCPAPVQIGP
eukprot:11222396-Lingulodinium_polyedra.AAC.1